MSRRSREKLLSERERLMIWKAVRLFDVRIDETWNLKLFSKLTWPPYVTSSEGNSKFSFGVLHRIISARCVIRN